jgi:hypothetical protein
MFNITAHFGMLEDPQQAHLSRKVGAQLPADCTTGKAEVFLQVTITLQTNVDVVRVYLLFICGFFNDVANGSDCILLNQGS